MSCVFPSYLSKEPWDCDSGGFGQPGEHLVHEESLQHGAEGSHGLEDVSPHGTSLQRSSWWASLGLQEHHRETAGTEIANGLGSSGTAGISSVPSVARDRPSAVLVLDERSHCTSGWGWLKRLSSSRSEFGSCRSQRAVGAITEWAELEESHKDHWV